MWFWLILIGLVAAVGYVRYGPSDPAKWHVDPLVTANQDLIDGVRRRLPGDTALLQRLHLIILETPRTEVLAGSPAEGRTTYITRSRWMAFPDYTTVQLDGDQIEIWARLRFGRSDLGVNKARVEGWLNRLNAGQDG